MGKELGTHLNSKSHHTAAAPDREKRNYGELKCMQHRRNKRGEKLSSTAGYVRFLL